MIHESECQCRKKLEKGVRNSFVHGKQTNVAVETWSCLRDHLDFPLPPTLFSWWAVSRPETEQNYRVATAQAEVCMVCWAIDFVV